MSGGAIYKPNRFPLVTGIVTANFEGFSVIDQVEERRRGEVIKRVISQRVITYGVALMLAEVEPWLKGLID